MSNRLQIPVLATSPHAPLAQANCRGGGKGYAVIQVESTRQLAERTSKRPVAE